MSVLAIIPARSGSKGIPNKNWRSLAGGYSPWMRACLCGHEVGAMVVTTTDAPITQIPVTTYTWHYLQRQPELATDTAAMIDVVKDVLARVPGESDQKIVLLQPTQPLRKPEHITKALELLTPEVDSVVSVVELPRTHHPRFQVQHDMNGFLQRMSGCQACDYDCDQDGEAYYVNAFGCNYFWSSRPTQRQDVKPTFIFDGTCYAFHRSTVERHRNIYGTKILPLIIDPADTCALDSMEDWANAERRLRELSR